MRGAFWYKEAILPEYDAHPILSAGANQGSSEILCSPNAIYTAMAVRFGRVLSHHVSQATMYTIRATLSELEYALFEQLTTDGVSVLKHPFRSGRPQKKRFQYVVAPCVRRHDP